MKTNVGKIDRALRVLAGLALVVLLILGPAPWKWLGLLGFVYLATALFRWCPAYALLGVNTCEVNKQKTSPSE